MAAPWEEESLCPLNCSALPAGWCNFRYTAPSPDFDKSRVHGVLARLVQVHDPSTTLALEVAAGSRLYQVRPCASRAPAWDTLSYSLTGDVVTWGRHLWIWPTLHHQS